MYPPTEPTAQPAQPEADDAATPATPLPLSDEEFGRWKSRITKAEQQIQSHDQEWKDNVAAMAGEPFKSMPESDTVNVPKDWSRTKNKQAQLFYRVPEIRLRARQDAYKPAAPVFGAALSFQLTHEIKADKVMEEILADTINAAGLGVMKVFFDGVFEQSMVPEQDISTLPPQQQLGMLRSGAVKMVPMTKTIYQCYGWSRISPTCFLKPADFIGTDWDKAPWLGFKGYMNSKEAQRKFHLTDEQLEKGGVRRDLLSEDATRNGESGEDEIEYYEIWYKAYLYDANERHPHKFRRLVIVKGKDDGPAIHEDSKWQRYDEATGKYVGLTKNPLRVLTLTYISDKPIPPSDSKMGRAQVQELIRSRSQMLRQRDRSQPLRWFDVNGVDEDVAEALRKGEWQDMIPMNGPGDRVIGEIARANYPRENFEFDNLINRDLDETWSMGPNQMGMEAPGETTAQEARIVAGSAGVRQDFERTKVLKFFVEAAECTGALMQMFQDTEDFVEIVGENGARSIETWDRNKIRGDYIFEAKPDSALHVDIGQERQEKIQLYQMVRQDPNANARAILEDVLRTHNIDPQVGMAPPPQPPPEKPNLSYRFSGEDLINPLALALLNKSGIVITEQDIQAAATLIKDAIQAQAQPPQPPGMPAQPGALPPGPGPAQPMIPHGGSAPQVAPLSKHQMDGKTS